MKVKIHQCNDVQYYHSTECVKKIMKFGPPILSQSFGKDKMAFIFAKKAEFK